MNLTLWTASNPHQGESFYVFTTKSSSAYHKCFDFSKFLLYISSENFDLIIVSTVCRSSVNFTFRKGFKDIIVKPLFQWTILSSKFNDLLCNYTSKECSLWANWTSWKCSSIFHDIFVNFLNKMLLFRFWVFIDLFGNGDYFCFIFRIWISCIFLLESMHCSYGKMELIRSTEVSEIRRL